MSEPRIYMSQLKVGIYPPGRVVRLSNERIGMVVSVKSRDSLRPQVLVYDLEAPRKEAP